MFKVVRWYLFFIITQFLLLFFMVFNYINSGSDINLVNNYISENRIYLVLISSCIFIPLFIYNYKKLNIKTKKTSIFKFILLGISLSLIYNFIGFYLDKLLNSNLYGNFDIISTLLSTVLLGPIVEEYLFRGLIYNDVKNKYGLKKALIITTILFAISHFTFIQIIYASILNIILVKIYERYNNINYCIIVHLFSNLTTTLITLILIKNAFIINFLIFIIGIILLFINNKLNTN